MLKLLFTKNPFSSCQNVWSSYFLKIMIILRNPITCMMHPAALIIDGKVVAAVEEEGSQGSSTQRVFLKTPYNSALNYAGIKIKDVDRIGASWKPWVLRVRATAGIQKYHRISLFFSRQRRWEEWDRLRKWMEGTLPVERAHRRIIFGKRENIR